MPAERVKLEMKENGTETRKVGGIERKKIKDNIQAELKKDIST